MSLHIAIIQHHIDEDAGYIYQWAQQRGIKLSHWQSWQTLTFTKASEFDGVIVLGGEKNVKDIAEDKVLQAERAWLTSALAIKLPCFGICLGGQLLVHLIGGSVSQLSISEYGNTLLSITNEGQHRKLHVLQAHDYQFHFDPERNFASSILCPQQLLISDQHQVTAMQCHPEWSNDTFVKLFPDHADKTLSATQTQAAKDWLYQLLDRRFLTEKR